MSAMERALGLPELLTAILEQVKLVNGPYESNRNLLACGLIRKVWFEISKRNLWISPVNVYTADDTMRPVRATLPLLFSKIEPERRQMYANLIENGNLKTEEVSAYYDEAIEGISFAKLRELNMYLDNGDHVTRVRGHQVRSLTLWLRYDVYPPTYGVYRDELDKILEQVAIVFPELEEVKFTHHAVAYVGTMEQFQSQIPRLTNFNHSSVRETDEDNWF